MRSTAEIHVQSGDSLSRIPSCHPTARSRSEAIALPRKTVRSMLREKSHEPSPPRRRDAEVLGTASVCIAILLPSPPLRLCGQNLFSYTETVIESLFKQRNPAQISMREVNV